MAYQPFDLTGKVALVTGACISMPVIVWQALLFVLPALHKNERRWVFVAVPFVTLAFAIGLASLERPELEIDSLPGGVVRVRVNALAEEDVVRRFDRAFPDFAGVTGLILDLRYAASGESRYGYEILARLTARAFPAARWRTPQYRPVFRAWRVPDSAFSWYGPPPDTVSPSTERAGYTGPVAVLASSATAGAAEDLLVAFRNAARGVIIGETSAGSPGEALTIALPKNWAMQLSVTRHAFPNGEEFAGRGIRPELPVASTVADVLAGTDAVLARAREYVSGKQR